MNSLKQIKQRQQMGHARLLHLKADLLHGISAQPKKATELVAIGVCVVVECRSCLEWHVARAARGGASFEEVLDAVESGIEVSGGRAAISARSATVVMNEVFGGSVAGVRGAGFDATHSARKTGTVRLGPVEEPMMVNHARAWQGRAPC